MTAQISDDRRADLKIVGNGTSNGGIFNKVKVVGEGEINGDVDCLTLNCTGTLEVDGGLRIEVLKATGTIAVTGPMSGEELNLTGNLSVRSGLKAGKARLNGEIRIEGGIAGEDIGLFGSCELTGNCQAERLRIKGALQTQGTINAEQVELAMFGRSQAGEIVGGQIRIAPHPTWKWGSLFKSWGTPELQATVIEGDVIRLENTVADIVRGGDVSIGPGCRIRLVEYTKHYHQDPNAEVGEHLNVWRNEE
ncbi:MAG: hypothetical protein E6Y08_07020 [Paenibacillus sp.]|uniref:hypothetical protein n=1 Tax=Paenibacillus sp. TaxID=58172 RepID=UPI00290C16A6|nr:hypothetical protein [Paenibacillus sp.]MDU4695549.1 hypothetical protein [Paenibacillus sp.]